MVKENKINLIFAVTEDQFSTYDRLSRYIEGSITVKLANDSSNIVELVKDQYNVRPHLRFLGTNTDVPYNTQAPVPIPAPCTLNVYFLVENVRSNRFEGHCACRSCQNLLFFKVSGHDQ